MAGRDVLDFLIDTTRTGNIESQCKDYLNNQTFRHKICLESGDYTDVLEFYAPNGSVTIQKIINDCQDLDTVRLRRPAPNILPIIISKIFNDSNSFIIPSETLNIKTILPRSPKYQLEAIICEINQHNVIFMKHLSTNEWYYYQKGYTCEQFNRNLSENLNEIIQSRSTGEQIRLINSAHFLVSMIFYHAIKYIYKQESD
jgi:hypothetical protein